MHKKIDIFSKEYITHEGSEITRTNEINHITKVIKSLEKRETLFKETNGKVLNQKQGFFGSLIRIDLPLRKNILTPLAKNVSLVLEVTTET